MKNELKEAVEYFTPNFVNSNFQKHIQVLIDLAKSVLNGDYVKRSEVEIDEDKVWHIMMTSWSIDAGNNKDERFRVVAKALLNSDIIKK